MRYVWVAALAATVAGCALVDPHNMIGRQLWDPGVSPVDVVPPAQRAPLSAEDRERAFEFVWRTIAEHYYDPQLHGADWNGVRAKYQPLAMRALDDEAFWDVLDRMTGELKDAHTRVESPQRAELRRADQTISLGFSFVPIRGRLVVTSVRGDTDAWWAGVRPGMFVTGIAGEDAMTAYERLIAGTRLDSTDRSRHMRAVRTLTFGEEGSRVAFAFERADGSRFEAELARKRISTRPTSSWRVLPSGIGYVRLTQWTLGVLPRVHDGIGKLRDAPGIIIDLRGNPGGSLHAVNSVVSKFFPEKTELGRVVTRTGKPITMLFGAVEVVKLKSEVGGDRDAYRGPVVILVNAASASGSEFFAATMQAAGRAVVAGQPTCGCMLGFLGYARIPGGADLAYSEVGFVMSNGKRIEGEGVQPDHHIPLTVDDLRFGRDRVLEEAQEIVRSMKPWNG